MSGLFIDEPTVQLRRSSENTRNTEIAEKQSQIESQICDRMINDFSIYSSPLLNCATELLGITMTLPRQGPPRDIGLFRQKLLDSIAVFREKGMQLDYHPNIIEKTCYIFCAVLDEMILYTSWGDACQWENKSLLSSVFSQRNGGEVFFVLLEKSSQQPAKLIDFIELQYILLMLGFKGRFRYGDENELNQVKSDTYSLIHRYRASEDFPVLSIPKLITQEQPWNFINLNKIFLIFILSLIFIFSLTEYWYKNRSQQILQKTEAAVLLETGQAEKNYLYASTNEDLGIHIPKRDEKEIEREKKEKQEWDLLLSLLNEEKDADLLIIDLKKQGYLPLTRKANNGIEIYMRVHGDIQKINKLKKELNARFGFSATIRRVSE